VRRRKAAAAMACSEHRCRVRSYSLQHAVFACFAAFSPGPRARAHSEAACLRHTRPPSSLT
jgi:hypothetical protein